MTDRDVEITVHCFICAELMQASATRNNIYYMRSSECRSIRRESRKYNPVDCEHNELWLVRDAMDSDYIPSWKKTPANERAHHAE